MCLFKSVVLLVYLRYIIVGLFIISFCMALFFPFYFLALWKHKLVNNVFISCCNEEEISLYIEELRSLVFVVFVFY